MNNFNKLKDFIIEKAALCLHKPDGNLKSIFVTPSFGVIAGADDQAPISARSLIGHYLQMYDWDACFFSQAADKIKIHDLGISIVDNFLSFQNSEGYIPRTISPHRIWDGQDMAKPFLVQTFLQTLKQNTGMLAENRKKNLTEYIERFAAYLDYFKQSKLNQYGLYHWRNVLESGVDNNLALLAPHEAAKDENYQVGIFPDGRLLASDLNAYLVAEFTAMSELASLASMEDISLSWKKQANELAVAINEKLWHEKMSIYCPVDPVTNQQITIRSWTGLAPLFYSLVPAERAQQIIEKNILNPEHFYRPAGLSSTAASELLYNQSKRGLYGSVIVSNWQGPMWILPNALTVRCLVKYGYIKQAQDLSQRVLKTMSEALNQTGTLFENYNAETGQPLWAPDFMSWNILALELIELIK